LHYEKKKSNYDNGEERLESEGGPEASSEGVFSFDAEFSGDHTLCFSNGDKDDNDGVSRLIGFNFRHSPAGQQDYKFVGLQSELEDLSQGLDLLVDHQSYMNQREDVHKEALESINTKVICWTVLEAVILISMALWQITYIKSFFEIQRRL
jgi:hypothetical protein